jgi:hypothetical protein
MNRRESFRRPDPVALVAFLAISAMPALSACSSPRVEIHGLEVQTSLEDRKEDGSMFTPETQSLLRGAHALETVKGLDIQVDGDDVARVELKLEGGDAVVFENMPLRTLVPRLHYAANEPPDAFDAFNLMLAEYSRNSVDFPRGGEGDEIAHFRSDLDGVSAPWTLEGDYRFKPNPRYMPNRMSLTNNCLGPGLWELNAVDTAGEIYHGWFGFPGDKYNELVARVNGLPHDFVAQAVIFDPKDAPVDLDRLRTVKEEIGTGEVALAPDSRAGYSSQGSRRKLGRGFCLVEKEGKLVKPEKLSDLTTHKAMLSQFQPPGKYSYATRVPFDMSFLATPQSAEFALVEPKTSYTWRWPGERSERAEETEYLELRVKLAEETLVFSNLPISLLVPTEDYEIHGFGVGILSAGEPAERRQLLIERGPLPSIAYLLREREGKTFGVNTHERGLEQVYIRTVWEGAVPRLEVILTSYERMVDLVKYEIEVPAKLIPLLRDAKLRYIPPIYRTYRDDNLR